MNEILLRPNVTIVLLVVILFWRTGNADATTFSLPVGSDSLVGKTQTATIQPGENLGEFLEKNHVGYLELTEANPRADLSLPQGGTAYIIPAQHLLPDAPRRGIVINLSEPRLYYYLPSGDYVLTYPIGIGREGVNTPVIQTKIAEKRIHPTWVPTEATRKRDAERGIQYPPFIPPGPDNPLGDYALRLGLPDYSIHGTNDPYGVGLRISYGCIRMNEDDIKELFSLVSVGTRVNIVDQPVKLGWSQGILYAEVHHPLRTKGTDHKAVEETTQLLIKLLKKEEAKYALNIDWDKALVVAQTQEGIPVEIGRAAQYEEINPVRILEAHIIKK